MVEFIKWAEQLSEINLNQAIETINQAVPSHHSSLLLLVCYVILSLILKRHSFLIAFVVCEIYGSLTIVNYLTDLNFYLGYSSIYCVLYLYCSITKEKIRVRLAVFTMVIFEFMAGMDAVIYSETQTVISFNYVGFIIAIHFYIIATLVNWRLLSIRLGQGVNAVFNCFRINDSSAFVGYNINRNSKGKGKGK